MKNVLTAIFLSLFVVFTMVFCWATPTNADFGSGVGLVQETDLPQTSIDNILVNIMRALLRILAPLFVMSIIIGGIIYVAAGGANSKFAELAQNIITYAIIGLVVTLLAYVILGFVAGSLYGGGGGWWWRRRDRLVIRIRNCMVAL